jgi:hypothetical protein
MNVIRREEGYRAIGFQPKAGCFTSQFPVVVFVGWTLCLAEMKFPFGFIDQISRLLDDPTGGLKRRLFTLTKVESIVIKTHLI